jgi:glycosyltransferase involved in cell wall biosynthesis
MKYGLSGHGPRLVERPLLRSFSHFVAVSPGIAARLRGIRPGATIRVIPNSAAAVFYQDESGKGHRTLEQPYILSLGRIDIYQKGLDRLIEAFEIMAEREAELRLVIAGASTPEQQRELVTRVYASAHRDSIAILGQVQPDEAAALLKGAVALAMPSRYEAWPLTAIEAGAAGVPVVGSDIVGVRDAAPPYPTAHGVLVPEGDNGALADAVLGLVGDEETRHRLAEKGRIWAAQFTWDALAASQLEFYKEIVGSFAT